MSDAQRLHDEALVIDGLVYHCDGDVTDLVAGGVNAINITTCHFEADFEQACAEIARWRGRLDMPASAGGSRSRLLQISSTPANMARLA